MQKKAIVLMAFLSVVFAACSDNPTVVAIKNEKKGQLKASFKLEETGVKRFLLDNATAPDVAYVQIYNDSQRNLTFLNFYNSSIYFYNYETLKFGKKISFDVNFLKRKINPTAYFIKSADSIYLYCKSMQLYLANDNGHISKTISLINNQKVQDAKWAVTYPQYHIQTAHPFMVTKTELLFPGQEIFTIKDSVINKFKFIAHIDFKTGKVTFSHTYPRNLYGFGYNWRGLTFEEVYTEFIPEENKLVFSFPVSHNLYLANVNDGSYKVVYGGSNQAGDITSSAMMPNKESNEDIAIHVLQNDEYAAIRYDKYRKVYYRFMFKAIQKSINPRDVQKKSVVVIIMDEKFNYLGETTIGNYKDFYLSNLFVTKEGLNIQCKSSNSNELYLTFKIYNIKKI